MATILVVDDRPVNRQFLTTLLAYDGHRLLEASDGAEALEQSRRERPDLVITDIVMPTMDGYELVRQLRADPAVAPTPVIFYTAHYHQQEAAALARACGACQLLTKPAEPEQILRSVRQALGSAHGGETPAPAAATPVPESFEREHLQLLTNTLAQKVDELRQAKQVAETSLAQLQAVFAGMNDGLILCNAQEVAAFNPAALAIHGFLPDFDARKPLREYQELFEVYDLEGNDVPFEQWPLIRAAAGQRVPACEVRVRRRDTRYEFIGSYGGGPVPGAGEQAGLAIVTVRDITAEKQGQEALRLSEQRFRSTFENAAVGIAHLTPDGHWLRVNRTFCEMLGYSNAGSLPGTLAEVTYPEDRQRDLSQFAALMRGELDHYTVEKRYLHRDGRVLWMSATRAAQRDEAGRPLYAISITQDITARKTAEAALHEAHAANEANLAQLRAVVGSMGEALVIADLDGNLLTFNPAALRLHGFESADEASKHLSELPRISEVRDMQGQLVPAGDWPIARAIRGEVFAGCEYRVRRRDTGREWVGSYSGTPVRDSQGKAALALVTIREITQQKLAEEELKAAKLGAERARAAAEQANRAKDHFLAVLSHELRTPLTPVLTTASLLHDDRAMPERYQEDIEMIRRNVELEARLIDDLLDVTRIARGKLELNRKAVALCDIIRRAVEVCQPDIEARRLHFGVDIGPNSPFIIHADPARLQQVFWNLLKNAIKFTPHGGCVGIRCRSDGNGCVLAEVNDSGEGIDPQLLPRIFNAFEQGGAGVTRQFGGLGLGLTITKGLVEMHGGTICAHSEGKGKGATFTVKLPVATRQPLAAAAAVPSSPSPQSALRTPQSLRILLVEDHGDTARVMKRLLRMDGHTVHAAGDVATALSLAASQPFDLLLSDLGLPDGSGVDLMRELRRRGQALPGIALSGYGQDEDIRRSKEAGFAAHLTKPTSPERLAEAIAAVTGQGSAPDHAG